MKRERQMMIMICTMSRSSAWWIGSSPVTTPLDVTESLTLVDAIFSVPKCPFFCEEMVEEDQ